MKSDSKTTVLSCSKKRCRINDFGRFNPILAITSDGAGSVCNPVATRSSQSASRPTASRRTQIVWGCFVAAMTVVIGALTVSDRESQQGFLAANLDLVSRQPAVDPIFQTAKALDHPRWSGIVIDHLGAPGGDAESVHRRHQAYGYQGLGYHFLIGNGNGLGDGVIHAGYRWNEQLPGAHTVGPAGEYHNQHSIGICLIGNGDRRPFTDRQIASLINLIQRLQRELEIPASDVHLHRELAADVLPPVTSPGRYFPKSQLLEQLR